jgi:hopanoid-associated phosphorylase
VPTILAVTGLNTEARIACSTQTRTVCSGGNAAELEAGIVEALGKDPILGMISFGFAGGLSPELPVGTIVLAKTIVSTTERYLADPVWLDRLAAKLPQAVQTTILGVNAPATEADQKARLGAETGAAVVDMESHIAARLAAARGCPFAALRVILDPMQQTLPPAALVAVRTNGKLNLTAVLCSLARTPSQLPPLIQTGVAAGRALDRLRHSRHMLDGSFCFPASCA